MVRDNPAIASAWARGQIRQIEDRYAAGDGDRTTLERAIVAISLKFQVLCRFTAYVAVDRSQTVNRSGSLHQAIQPVEMPAGWGVADWGLACYHTLGAERAPSLVYSARRGSGKVVNPPVMLFRMSESLPHDKCDSSPLIADLCRSADLGSSYDDSETIVDSVEEGMQPGGPTSADLPTDRFKIGQIVASGGMGRIYQGYDRDLGREVRLKIIEDKSHGPEMLERWRRQKEVLEQLNHPAIPPAIEVGSSGESFWVATPRFTGRTLAEVLRSSGPLPPRGAATLVACVAEVLQFAHEHGVVHGDLTPSNIFLGDDGQTRLFGFSEAPPRANDSSSSVRALGTLSYMAPELLRNEAGVNVVRCEVYALGVVLYEVLTGQVPFPGASFSDLISKIPNEKTKPPRKLKRSIPAALESICLKAMSKKPSDRYATAGELAAALRGFLAPARRRGFWKAT
jgi:serine/threonine protein kinase